MDKGLLADATSQDDTPTPGYMLNEISRSTLSNYQACVQIQDYLLSRVAHKHHNVKYKALVIVKHVCRTGRPEFKREIQRKVDPIKECLQFKGTPDPLRGDEPNRRVRDAAKEALDAIFDSQMPVTTSAVAAANRIQGMGNDWTPPESSSSKSGGLLSSIVSTVSNAVLGDGTEVSYAGHPGATGSMGGIGNSGKIGGYPGGGGGGGSNEYGGYSSSGMAGIGNPNFRDARQEKSWVQMASEYVSGKPTPQGPPVSFAAPVGSDYKFTTNRGANAFGSNDTYSPSSIKTNTSFQQWQQPPSGGIVPDLPQGPLGTGRAGGATSDGSYERSLIESLCEPGGLKPVPNEQKLAEFLNTAPTLSSDLIGLCLLDCMNSDSWQSRTKALMVTHQLVQTTNCGAHEQFWQQHVEDVRALLQDSKAGVRTQASKLVKVLCGENGTSMTADESSVRNTSSPMPRSGPANNESLLDILDGPSQVPPAMPAYTSPAMVSGMDGADSLFAGMSLGGQAANLPPASVPPPVPVKAASSAISDFEFLMGDAAAPPAAPMMMAPAPMMSTPSSNNNGFSGDLFGDMSLNPSLSSGSVPTTTNTMSPAPMSSNTTANAFDFMDDLTASPAVPPLSSTQTAPSGPGGFSFMSNDNNTRPVQSSSSAISSSFAEPPKKDMSNSFQDLTASFMTAPMNGNNQGAPRNVPLNQMMMPQQPQQTPYGGYAPAAQPFQYGQPGYQQPQSGYQQQPQPGYGAMPMGGYGQPRPMVGGSVLAPGMLNPVAPRKAIPDAASAGPNSGFSFMGGSPQKTPGGSSDSFSFVTDTMKDLVKK